MLTILLHSSKTMRQPAEHSNASTSTPMFEPQANELIVLVSQLSDEDLIRNFHLSPTLLKSTRVLLDNWTNTPTQPAIDCFLGDIYSGLQASNLDAKDRLFAQKHLRILSGLYGVLSPLDGIRPYRLEMGYKIPALNTSKVSTFWRPLLQPVFHETSTLINLSAAEYTDAVIPELNKDTKVISPKFLTINPKTNNPTFVAVHAKIARGAYAHWMIKNRLIDTARLTEFSELGYEFSRELSSETEPVFIAETFKGLGLSVRKK